LNKLTRCFTTFKKRNLDATEQKLARTLLGYLFNEYIEDLKLFAEMAKGSEDLEFLHDRLMSGHGDLIRGGFHEEAEQLLKASNF